MASYWVRALPTGQACAGSLLLRVTPVEDVGGEEGNYHKAGRPAETRSKWVINRKIDKNREPADRCKHEHNQDPADCSVTDKEQLDFELPPWPMLLVDVSRSRRVREDALAPSHPIPSASGQAFERNMLDLALSRR